MTTFEKHFVRAYGIGLAILFVFFLINAPVGCAFVDKVDPTIKPTPTPGQPCGPIDTVCYTADGKINGCCGEYDTCGGPSNNSCPADTCCNLGGITEFGMHRQTKMRPALTR